MKMLVNGGFLIQKANIKICSPKNTILMALCRNSEWMTHTNRDNLL